MLSKHCHATEIFVTNTASAIRPRRCATCGTAPKSGQMSCCARGGTWFKKCGDPGDTNFDYTWDEGFKACIGVANPLLVGTPAQAHQEMGENIDHPTNTTGLQNTAVAHLKNVTGIRNDTGKHTKFRSTGTMSFADATDCSDRGKLAKLSKFTILLLFSFCLERSLDSFPSSSSQ